MQLHEAGLPGVGITSKLPTTRPERHRRTSTRRTLSVKVTTSAYLRVGAIRSEIPDADRSIDATWQAQL